MMPNTRKAIMTALLMAESPCSEDYLIQVTKLNKRTIRAAMLEFVHDTKYVAIDSNGNYFVPDSVKSDAKQRAGLIGTSSSQPISSQSTGSQSTSSQSTELFAIELAYNFYRLLDELSNTPERYSELYDKAQAKLIEFPSLTAFLTFNTDTNRLVFSRPEHPVNPVTPSPVSDNTND